MSRQKMPANEPNLCTMMCVDTDLKKIAQCRTICIKMKTAWIMVKSKQKNLPKFRPKELRAMTIGCGHHGGLQTDLAHCDQPEKWSDG